MRKILKEDKIMKKSFLFLGVCMAVLLFSGCSTKDSNVIVEIPDANFKAYLLENFDKNKDGNISLSEAKAVKEINCSGKGIEKLDGIEKFTNITLLDCSNNKLEELELSSNKKLEKLICKGNIAGMFIYVPMSGKLRNQNIPMPKPNQTPQVASMGIKPLDLNRCIFDEELTNISLNFDE